MFDPKVILLFYLVVIVISTIAVSRVLSEPTNCKKCHSTNIEAIGWGGDAWHCLDCNATF